MRSVRERVARNQTNVNWQKKKKLFLTANELEQHHNGICDAIFLLQGKFNFYESTVKLFLVSGLWRTMERHSTCFNGDLAN